MKNKEKIQTIVNEITDLLVNKLYDFKFVNEASGFDGIFDELKSKLSDISMLPDNVIYAGKYK